MKILKRTIATLVAAICIFAVNTVGVNAEWKKDTRGWWYSEGSSWAVGWRNIDGKWYYFYDDGYMAECTTKDGCYVDEQGAWVDDSSFNTSAAKAIQLVKDKYFPDTNRSNFYVRAEGFDGENWTIHAMDDFYDHTATAGWYYVNKDTGEITSMF